MATAVSFNGNDLQTGTINTTSVEHEAGPELVAQLVALAHANRSVVPYTSYPTRHIPITGRISAASVAACDAALDSFRSYFTAQDANLDVGYNGGTRRYVGSVITQPTIDRPRGMAYADFSVVVACTIPWGLNTSNTTALNAVGRTASTYSDGHTFLGTAPQQAPVFTYTLTAVTGGTAATVSIGNNDTGQAISITRDWANSDVMVIDTSAKVPVVTINGTAVDYTGAFPYFTAGSGTMTYADTFTTRTFTENVVYVARYL